MQLVVGPVEGVGRGASAAGAPGCRQVAGLCCSGDAGAGDAARLLSVPTVPLYFVCWRSDVGGAEA